MTRAEDVQDVLKLRAEQPDGAGKGLGGDARSGTLGALEWAFD